MIAFTALKIVRIAKFVYGGNNMIHEFDPVIYPRKLWITYDATPEELNNFFPGGYNNGTKFKEEDGYYGITYAVQKGSDNKGGVLIRFADSKEALEPWNVSHEAVHAAAIICQYVGIIADWDNDEAFAYLVTWVTKCCYKGKKKIKL